MKRSSRAPFRRLAIVAVLAVVIGAFAPVFADGQPASAATDGQMVYPASGNIQSKVGDGCRDNYRAHDGIDISNQGGTPILAAYDGVIKTRTANSGYGNYVDIEHPGGYVTRYGHMASPGMQAPGTRVTRGQQIGVVGKTGATTAYHLHFEVWRNGSVYAAINNGFTCLANVSRGATIPMTFPGLATASNPSTVLSADYNGDGKADLLGIAGDSDLHFLAGNGSGSFQSASIITGVWGNRRHVTHTDFNGDKRADILVARSDGVLELYAGNASGGFGSFSSIATGWYDMLHVASGADYTGDGKQDVLVVTADGTLMIYAGNGSGGFSGSQTIGPGWQYFPQLVGGDFNNDGRGDIMAVDNEGRLHFYPGVTNGFSDRWTVGGGWAEFTALTGGVDYDGDSKADFLARTAQGELYLYPGNGSGSIGERSRVGTGFGGYLLLE